MAAPGRVLFLATDTPQVREEARRRYGARAYFQQVSVAHTGQQHALSVYLFLSLWRARLLPASARRSYGSATLSLTHTHTLRSQ